jgi:SAM-dependent MidA family methyltransferase
MLPSPTPDALAYSQQLSRHIQAEIAAADGWMNFARFMELALYAPGLGYYVAGARKFGAAGDFVTAPEISPLFGYCLAGQCGKILTHLQQGDILEFGAGTGKLALDVLTELARQDNLPRQYYILELSPDLRQRQQQTLVGFTERVVWLDTLPDNWRGVVLANEVLDAMPVRRFYRDANAWLEWGVSVADGQFQWLLRPASPDLEAALSGLDLAAGYSGEINLSLAPWLQALFDSMTQGAVLLIDYGFPRHEYYHPQRTQGTLMCHYRHHAHDDPFFLPGLQDITAHVDFSAVAIAAEQTGFHVAGFATQADFLLGSGLAHYIQQADPNDLVNYIPLINGMKKLVMPEEMGELFKVVGLSKKIELTLPGRDRCGRL